MNANSWVQGLSAPAAGNYHRLHGELGWQTPCERFDGTPFTDRGFESVPALARVADLLDALIPV